MLCTTLRRMTQKWKAVQQGRANCKGAMRALSSLRLNMMVEISTSCGFSQLLYSLEMNSSRHTAFHTITLHIYLSGSASGEGEWGRGGPTYCKQGEGGQGLERLEAGHRDTHSHLRLVESTLGLSFSSPSIRSNVTAVFLSGEAIKSHQ